MRKQSIRPIKINRFDGGTQKLFRFKNGYGASVIRHNFSYGHESGKWELAVLSGAGQRIDYSTPITSDVLGWLSPAEVQKHLRAIKALPKQSTRNA